MVNRQTRATCRTTGPGLAETEQIPAAVALVSAARHASVGGAKYSLLKKLCTVSCGYIRHLYLAWFWAFSPRTEALSHFAAHGWSHICPIGMTGAINAFQSLFTTMIARQSAEQDYRIAPQSGRSILRNETSRILGLVSLS